MGRFRELFEAVLLGLAALLPLAGAVLAGLARWRIGRGIGARLAWSRSVAEVGMVAGTAPWLVMALWPMDRPPDATRWYLLPMSDIASQLGGPPGEALIQIVANLLLFFALGVFAPLRVAALADPARLLMLGAAASLVLEVSQQVFGTGRVFSVDDVLLNALGCLFGGLVSRRWWAVPRSR